MRLGAAVFREVRRHTAAVVILAGLAPALLRAQQDREQVLTLRVASDKLDTTRHAEILKALAEITDLPSSSEIVDSAATARRICPGDPVGWRQAFEAINAQPSPSGTRLPPCLVQLPVRTVLTAGDTVARKATLFLGRSDNDTLEQIAVANSTSVEKLRLLHTGDAFAIPAFANVALRLRTDISDVQRRAGLTALANIASPAFDEPLHIVVPLEVRPGSPGSCAATLYPATWPFDPGMIADILASNALSPAARSRRHATIGVVDTGLEPTDNRFMFHRRPLEQAGSPDVDDDDNSYVDDDYGVNLDHTPGFPAASHAYPLWEHGTHVTGLVLGGLANDRLSAAVKPLIGVRPLNVVSCSTTAGTNGPVTSCFIPPQSVEEAIRYAGIDPWIPIVNVSLQTGMASTGMKSAIQNSPSLIVIAAGNDNADLDLVPEFPVDYAGGNATTLVVAATEPDESIASFSNHSGTFADIAAPGCHIESTYVGGTRRPLSGTSQAAPLVSFAAALLFSEGLTVSQVHERLLATVDIRPQLRGSVRSSGMLNIARALRVYDDVVEDAAGRAYVGTIAEPACINTAGACRPWTQIRRLTSAADEPGVAVVVSATGGSVTKTYSAPPRIKVRLRAGGTIELPWVDVASVTPAARR
jgi:hypothetical protein